ncbi:MAG: hypothetical protein ACRDWA_06650 [Acidimicrobiia bacterium]
MVGRVHRLAIAHVRTGFAVISLITACSEPQTLEATAPPTTNAVATTVRLLTLEATGAPLAPGRYTRTDFLPTITFDLDDDWEAVQLEDGFFDVQMDSGSPDVIAIQFARPSRVVGNEEEVEPTSAAAAVAILGRNADLEVVESSGSRIGGLEGSQVTVENAGSRPVSVMRVPPGLLGIDPGRRLWIAFFDTADGLLAIMIGGASAEWEAALAAAEPVLESVAIGD